MILCVSLPKLSLSKASSLSASSAYSSPSGTNALFDIYGMFDLTMTVLIEMMSIEGYSKQSP